MTPENRPLDYRRLFDSAPGIYLVLAPDAPRFTILGANAARFRVTGSGPDQLGRGLFEVFPDNPADPNASGTRNLRASLERVLKTRAPDAMAVQKYDIPRSISEGGGYVERYWSPQNVPVFDDDGRLIYIIHRVEDVTEYVKQAGELRAKAEAGAAEIFARAQEIQRARLELETANQELDAFNRTVSHDLRAPLRSMVGFSRILMEDHGAGLPSEAREHLDRIVKAAVRMGDLIDGLLALSRLSRAELRRVMVDLSAMARAAAAELRSEHAGRSVECAVEDGLAARGDPQLVEILLRNLLANAWKFTARRARASIQVGRAAGGAFFVRDNGAGFDMRFSDKLFCVFQRLHSERDFPGTGIGLATVKRIAIRHGGRAWAEGAPEEGATFYFELEGERPQ